MKETPINELIPILNKHHGSGGKIYKLNYNQYPNRYDPPYLVSVLAYIINFEVRHPNTSDYSTLNFDIMFNINPSEWSDCILNKYPRMEDITTDTYFFESAGFSFYFHPKTYNVNEDMIMAQSIEGSVSMIRNRTDFTFRCCEKFNTYDFTRIGEKKEEKRVIPNRFRIMEI